MNLGKVKIWVGVGGYVLSGAAAAAIAAPDRATDDAEVAVELPARSSDLKIAQGVEV